MMYLHSRAIMGQGTSAAQAKHKTWSSDELRFFHTGFTHHFNQLDGPAMSLDTETPQNVSKTFVLNDRGNESKC